MKSTMKEGAENDTQCFGTCVDVIFVSFSLVSLAWFCCTHIPAIIIICLCVHVSMCMRAVERACLCVWSGERACMHVVGWLGMSKVEHSLKSYKKNILINMIKAYTLHLVFLS